MMRAVLQLTFAVSFPLVLLVMILWLSHLEDTLPQSVRRTVRRPDPPPVLAIPMQRRPVHDELPARQPAEPTGRPTEPTAQSAEPTGQPADQPAEPARQPEPGYTPEVSRAEELSLGGSTNR